MAQTKLSKLERAERTMANKLRSENRYKQATSAGQGTGTHNGYVRVEHRAVQRSVERLGAKIAELRGARKALASWDRAAIRVARITELADVLLHDPRGFKGDARSAYEKACERNQEVVWLAAAGKKCPKVLAVLWGSGLRFPSISRAIEEAYQAHVAAA